MQFTTKLIFATRTLREILQ